MNIIIEDEILISMQGHTKTLEDRTVEENIKINVE